MHDPSQSTFPEPGGVQDKPPPLADLPPVEAPSASFVVQLFVIPAIVVAVVIMVWLLFGKLAGGERDPAEYVRRLRQGSGDWRSAFELASLIQNDAKLASDPRLLGELADLLTSELEAKTVDTQLTVYVIKTIGAFQTLDATLADGRKVDPIESLTWPFSPGTSLPSGWKRRPAWPSRPLGWRASWTTLGWLPPWPRRRARRIPSSARWLCMRWDSSGGKNRPRFFELGFRKMTIATSATTPPLPWAGEATPRPPAP